MNAKLSTLISVTAAKVVKASREPMLERNAMPQVQQLLTEFAIALEEIPPTPTNPPTPAT